MSGNALVPLQPWNIGEKLYWLFNTLNKPDVRDYEADITNWAEGLCCKTHRVVNYGCVSVSQKNYPLIAIEIGGFSNKKPIVLLSSGVHGYEPSGVKANKHFVEHEATDHLDNFNFVVPICICPWPYEKDERLVASTADPNRGNGHEMRLLKEYLGRHLEKHGRFVLGMDFHETSDRDIDLRILRAANEGSPLEPYWRVVPQGTHIIMTDQVDAGKNIDQLSFGQKIIGGLEEILSPVAPEEDVMGNRNFDGIVLSKARKGLFRELMEDLCHKVVVTEVYPDHPNVGSEGAVQAQLALMRAGLREIKTVISQPGFTI